MANQRAQVDQIWFERSASVRVRGESLQVLPKEEFLWCKLYIMQRDHCDWPDLLNLLYAVGVRLDWSHLLWRVEEDTPVLQALLLVYKWLCPKAALKLPAGLWRKLARAEKLTGRFKRNHIRLLDTRAWFAALQPTPLLHWHAESTRLLRQKPSGAGKIKSIRQAFHVMLTLCAVTV